VSVELERDLHHLRLWIEDDGRGFADSARVGQGLGLQNMAERVSILDGKLTIDSRPGAGTRVEVIIPIREPA
jgi:two-component system NarL family sensor kinase